MEQDQLPCASARQAGADREAFERVWRRVMPEDRPDCPFTLYSEEDVSQIQMEEVLTPPAAAAAPPARVQAAPAKAVPAPPAVPCVPAVPAPLPQPCVTAQPAPPREAVCLGSASAVYGCMLQEFIADEIADWRLYQGLARRVGGSAGRTLSGMAADERRHAKRLSTAYFLISGVQYWPDKPPAAPAGTFLGVLRERFGAEQRGEAAYRAAAAETADPCLKELYLELAGDEGEHAWLIRGILEQM